MKSQYPSSAPVEFPDTPEGWADKTIHDYQWAYGSGYLPEGEPEPNRENLVAHAKVHPELWQS